MPLPALPEDGALLRVLACGLCGSDLEKLHAHRDDVAEGSVLGHEVVGVLEALGPEAPPAWQVGQRVVASHHAACGACVQCLRGSESMCAAFKCSNFIPGGFADCLALSRAHLETTVFTLPAEVSDAAASTIEPLACVLKAARRTAVFSAELPPPSVVVLGLGFIGLLAVEVYRQLGWQVWGVDKNPARQAWAVENGYLPPTQVLSLPLADGWRPSPASPGADVVFFSNVNAAALRLGQQVVRPGGLWALFSGPGPVPAPVDPAWLYYHEVSVVPSYSPSRADLRQAWQWVTSGQVRVAPLVTHEVAVTEIAHGVGLAQRGEAIKVLVRFG
jgi:L-iditol 2-dehydrogenase